jgi:hypothetical protein
MTSVQWSVQGVPRPLPKLWSLEAFPRGPEYCVGHRGMGTALHDLCGPKRWMPPLSSSCCSFPNFPVYARMWACVLY